MNYVPGILTRNEAKKAILDGIDFVQSIYAIKDNNQFTSSQKPVWVFRKNYRQTKSEKQQQSQQNAQKNKERYKSMPL